MSGFSNRESKVYFNIIDGKFCINVPEGTEGAKSRINKNGKVVHEVYHDSFTGLLTGIRVTESLEYGKSWNFDFVAGGEEYTLKLSYSNSFAQNFLKMLPNIDLSKEFKITPVTKVVEGKNQSSLFINQDGESVKHAFTRENPNGMPDLVKVKVSGKETWDDSDRLEFFEAMVNTTIVPKLEGNKRTGHSVASKGGVIETLVSGDGIGVWLSSDVSSDDDFGMGVDEEINPEDLPF